MRCGHIKWKNQSSATQLSYLSSGALLTIFRLVSYKTLQFDLHKCVFFQIRDVGFVTRKVRNIAISNLPKRLLVCIKFVEAILFCCILIHSIILLGATILRILPFSDKTQKRSNFYSRGAAIVKSDFSNIPNTHFFCSSEHIRKYSS